jgi:hypothetical protein
MSPGRFARVLSVVALASALGVHPAWAQEPASPRPVPRERPSDPPRAPEDPIPADDPAQPVDDEPPTPGAGVSIRPRLFGLVGFQSFAASNSFSAVLDASSGPVLGGGGGVLLGRNLFVDVSISHFSADGTRVFVTDGDEIIDLGVATQVTVMPIDVSIGWRLAGAPALTPAGKPRFRAVPFVGGGFGFQQYKETSEFSAGEDDADESNGSYHVLGGIELPFGRTVGASADVLYRWVPDAIGTGGVSAHYDETDLGGVQVRMRVVVTF